MAASYVATRHGDMPRLSLGKTKYADLLRRRQTARGIVQCNNLAAWRGMHAHCTAPMCRRGVARNLFSVI